MKQISKIFSIIFLCLLVVLPVTQNNAEAATRKKIVVLDPGHAGSAPGASATWNGVTFNEEQITWKIANACATELSKYPDIEVHLTRNSYSPDTPLVDRVKVAANLNADILVSLHINWAETSGPNGANLLITNGNYRPELEVQEKLFGSFLQNEFEKIGLAWRGYYLRDSENGSKYPNGKIRDYYSIIANSVEMNVVGVLIEHGFVTNYSDAHSFMSSEAAIRKLGVADANAIVKYLNNTDYRPGERSGWYENQGEYYYYKDGKLLTNQLLKLGDDLYYLDATGKRFHGGFKVVGGKSYYFQADGKAQKGWLKKGGKFFYFAKTTGVMFKNILSTNSAGVYTYFDNTGAMAINQWVDYAGKTYYFDSQGHAVKGLYRLNGKYYFFNSVSAYLRRNIKMVSAKGDIYYIDPNGVRVQNKVVVLLEEGRRNTYAFGPNGVAYKGWQIIGGNKYYFGKTNGHMARGCSITNPVNGIVSVFAANGVLVRQYKS